MAPTIPVQLWDRNNMLRFRLNVGLWVVMILLLTTAASEWYLMQGVETDIAKILEQTLPRMTALHRIRNSIIAINASNIAAAVSQPEPKSAESVLDEENTIREGIAELHASERLFPVHPEGVKKITTGCEEYLRLIAVLRSLDPSDQTKRRGVIAKVRALMPELNAASSEVFAANEGLMRRGQEKAAQAVRDTRLFVLLAIAIAVCIAIVQLLRVNRRVIRPVEDLASAAKAAGEGNLDSRIPIASDDELGYLAREFNSMLDRLQTYRQTTSDEIIRLTTTMRALMASFPDPIFVLNPNREVERMNPAAERLSEELGVPGALPTQLSLEAIEQEDGATEDARPTAPRTVSLHIRGEEHHYIPKLVPMRDERGRELGLALVLDDITLLQLRDQLKSNLVSTVSHEVKTPVTSIRMVIYMLLEKLAGPLTPQQEDLLETAKEETNRLLRLLQNLLDMARYEHGTVQIRWEECLPETLCTDALEQVSLQQLGADQQLELSMEERLQPVLGDPDLLRHALTNFLSNAVKYAPAGTTISVVAKRAENGGVTLGVQDHGPGIPSEHQEHVFDKFFRVPGQRASGTGLGLAIAREIVTLHGGVIGCESSPGQGCLFYFTLPNAEEVRKRIGMDGTHLEGDGNGSMAVHPAGEKQ